MGATSETYTTRKPIERVLAAFPDARKTGWGWQARCTAHDDDKASLTIQLKEDGETVWLKCHAGCDNRDVVKTAGLAFPDLSPDEPKHRGIAGASRKVVARYDYVMGGVPVFQVLRFEPKGFAQRRPDGRGGWINNLRDITPCLYHHDEIVESDDIIPVCEGEKDADNLRALGLVATTAPMGAGKWRPEYTATLAGREVVLLPHNDEPGRKHMEYVASELHSAGCTVQVVELPGLSEHGDVSDWLAMGFTVEDLIELIREAPVWTANDGEKVSAAYV